MNRLPYVHEYRDRHGKVRRYFRRRGSCRIPLRGRPGSMEYMTAYNAALAGQFGVPVAFISGDRLAVTQLQQVAPGAEGAIVKEPYGYHSANTVTPARGVRSRSRAIRRAQRQGHLPRHDRGHETAAGAHQSRASMTTHGPQRLNCLQVPQSSIAAHAAEGRG